MSSQRYEPDADLSQLLDHPDNPRVGDDQAVGDSIDVLGFYGAIIAQQSTRRILAGHTRRRALTAAGAARAPVIWLDVDDATASKILLADNRYAELAVWDSERLAAMLTGMPGDLAGTGFTAADLDILNAVHADALPPENSSRDYDTGHLGPVLVIHAPAEVIEEFRALPGEDDLARLTGLLAEAAR